MRRATHAPSGLVRLLQIQGWPRMFTAYAFSRMSAGTVAFSLLLIGQREQHNLAHGAVAVTGYALAAAVVGPATARLADRKGVRRVLVVTAVLYTEALAAVAATATLGVVWLTLTATLAGAVMPPIGPTFRATLTEVLPDALLRSAALTIESMLVEAIQVAGPFLVTACVAILAPQLALVLITTYILLNTLTLTTHPPLQDKPVARVRSGSPLFTGQVLSVIAIWLVFTGALSAMEVIAVAFAGPSRVWLAGLSVAVLAGGSIVGGLLMTTTSLPGSPARQLQALLAFMGLAVTGLFLAHTPLVFVLLVGLAALAVAPSMGIIMTLLGQAVAPDRRAEAFGWMASANYVGAALWTAGAGALADHGTGPALGLACLSLLGATVLALRVRPVPLIVLDPSPPAAELVLSPAGPVRAAGHQAGGR